jgi:hypothetical protein
MSRAIDVGDLPVERAGNRRSALPAGRLATRLDMLGVVY